MKPEAAFVSGAVLGVAGAYLYKNYESGKELKGGAQSTSSKILEAGSTIKSITSFCEKYPTEYSCKDGVLFNKTITILFKYPSDKTVSNKTYIIPDSVTNLYDGSFYDVLSDNLKTITATPKLIEKLKKINLDNIFGSELYNLIIKDNNNNKKYNFYADQKKKQIDLKRKIRIVFYSEIGNRRDNSMFI